MLSFGIVSPILILSFSRLLAFNMFRLLIFISACFIIVSSHLNGSYVEKSRNKRQNNQNFKCGIQYSVTGFIAGGTKVEPGEFPWYLRKYYFELC